MEPEFGETIGALLDLVHHVYNKKMRGNKWFRDGCPTLFIPLHPTFEGDYDRRRSTKFIFWITTANEIIVDISHIRKNLLFIISRSSVRCILKSKVNFDGVLISKVGGYCINYDIKPATSKRDHLGWISLLEYKDKKGRLHRSDGKPAFLERLHRGCYTYKTYKHGKLHSYGEAPAIIEYDAGGEIIKEHFYHKGLLLGTIEDRFEFTYYKKGKPVARFRDVRNEYPEKPCGDPNVECRTYDTTIFGDNEINASIIDKPNTTLQIITDFDANIPLAKRFLGAPWFERRLSFDYPALPGYFYGTTSSPRFKTERYYFVHLNEPLDKPIYKDGKVVRWEVTSLADELRSTTQLYFKGQKVWQPFIPLSSFRTGGIFITTEVFTFSLKPEFMNLKYIWHLSPFGVSGVVEPPTGIKWIDSKPQVQSFDHEPIVREPEGWDGDSLPVLVKDMEESPFKKGELGNQHFGQRKLLLSEIEFLTNVTEKHGDEPVTVFYAGAAPGEHTPLLVDMFPQVTFVLFDPHFKDNKSKVRIPPRKRMFIINDFFYGDEFDLFGEEVYFISDIRTDNSNEQVDENNKLQNKWVSHEKVKGAMLKLRFPFGAGKSLAPDGVLVTQAWAPDSSAECRLFTKGKKLIKYDHLTHEGRMFYFNSVLRKLKYTKLDPIFGVSYDVMREAGIIHNYLANFFDGDIDRVIISWMAWFDEYLHRTPKVYSMVSKS